MEDSGVKDSWRERRCEVWPKCVTRMSLLHIIQGCTDINIWTVINHTTAVGDVRDILGTEEWKSRMHVLQQYFTVILVIKN